MVVLLGAFLPSFILSTGEVDREMKARAGEDFEAPGKAMAGGAMVASRSTLPPSPSALSL